MAAKAHAASGPAAAMAPDHFNRSQSQSSSRRVLIQEILTKK
jgi:hypothetical protein